MRLVSLPVLAGVLIAGCGGSGGGSTGTAPGATPTATGASATFNANLSTGKVTVGSGDLVPSSRAVFGGNAVRFDVSDLFTESGGDLRRRAVEVKLTNTSAEPIGANGKIRITMPPPQSTSDFLFDRRSESTVQTRMGIGTAGNNDAPVASAQINEPMGVAFGPANTLFAVTTGDNRTRVLRQGLVSTVAGVTTDPFDVLRFELPDGREQLLVSDPGASVLRLITVVSGSVTVAAGVLNTPGNTNGAANVARFTSPAGMCLETGSTPTAGAVLVADNGNNLIRRCEYVVTASGLQITNVTTRISTVTAPIDVAQNEQRDIAVTETDFNRVKVYVGGGSNAPVFGGVAGDVVGNGSTVQFSAPWGITSVGNTFYIMDLNNRQLKSLFQKPGSQGLLAVNWQVSRIAGNGNGGYVDGSGLEAEFVFPQMISASETGRIAISDRTGHRVREVTTSNNQVFIDNPNGSTGAWPTWANPTAVDATGLNYIEVDGPLAPGESVDLGKLVFLVPEETVSFSFQLRVTGETDTPAPPDAVISSEARGSKEAWVTTVAGSQREGFGNGIGIGAGFGRIADVHADDNGNLYVADDLYATVRMVTPKGAVYTLFGSALSPGSSDGNGTIATIGYVRGLWVNGSGTEILMVDSNNAVRRAVRSETSSPILPSSWILLTMAGGNGAGFGDGPGGVAQFDGPSDIIRLSGGEIWIADTNNHRIRRVRPVNSNAATASDHIVDTVLGSTAGDSTTQMNLPSSLAESGLNFMAVADSGNNKIKIINLNNQNLGLQSLAGSGTATPALDANPGTNANLKPIKLATDKAGYIYFSDDLSIRRVRLIQSEVRTVAGRGSQLLDANGFDVGLRQLDSRGLFVLPNGDVVFGDGPRLRKIERIIVDGG